MSGSKCISYLNPLSCSWIIVDNFFATEFSLVFVATYNSNALSNESCPNPDNDVILSYRYINSVTGIFCPSSISNKSPKFTLDNALNPVWI